MKIYRHTVMDRSAEKRMTERERRASFVAWRKRKFTVQSLRSVETHARLMISAAWMDFPA